jgi:hypothetical protein
MIREAALKTLRLETTCVGNLGLGLIAVLLCAYRCFVLAH